MWQHIWQPGSFSSRPEVSFACFEIVWSPTQGFSFRRSFSSLHVIGIRTWSFGISSRLFRTEIFVPAARCRSFRSSSSSSSRLSSRSSRRSPSSSTTRRCHSSRSIWWGSGASRLACSVEFRRLILWKHPNIFVSMGLVVTCFKVHLSPRYLYLYFKGLSLQFHGVTYVDLSLETSLGLNNS